MLSFGHPTGAYTTKSDYACLLSHSNMVANVQTYSSWSWIWKLKSTKKHIFLFWLACQNSVPTLLLLSNRNMASSGLCSRCGLKDETFLHCFCDCNFSYYLEPWWIQWCKLLHRYGSEPLVEGELFGSFKPSFSRPQFGGLGVTEILCVLIMRYRLLVVFPTTSTVW